MRVRHTAVAGRFYAADPEMLRADVEQYLGEAREGADLPKALIAPHAGYMYSGPIAGTGYASVRRAHDRIRTVVLLGPAHFVPVRGVVASSADAFRTPLGEVPVDRRRVEVALELPQVWTSDEAHAPEHSLEVHLPFLQVVLDDFRIVPLLVGDASGDDVAEVIERLWGGPETLIVVSSDLSHYHDDLTARALDEETARAIEAFETDAIVGHRACGSAAIRGLLRTAHRKGLAARLLDLRNSAATAGPRDDVVGYGAFAIV